MGASATDIITYVGVPLAVVGVLPTMYTCVKSVFTLRDIRRILERNSVGAITRSSLLSGIIEVEIPRKSITPLDRDDPPYFELSPTPSTLRGGTWMLLNWRELTIGSKGYRLQYHDELFQPQAEVEFEQLIAYLLDLGAVPGQGGFSDLRNSGLWTPAGTKLLLSPCTADAVLSVSASDDSDGILSLTLDWRSEWNRRGTDDLPPYWMRLRTPNDDTPKRLIPGPQKQEDEVENPKEEQEKKEKPFLHVDEKHQKDDHSSIYSHPDISYHGGIKMRIGQHGVEDIIYEDSPKRKFRARHLRSHHDEPNSQCLWFACAATALAAPQGGLWSYAIAEDIIAFSRLESIPCGVLVLLDLIQEDSVPTWRTPFDDKMERVEAQQKFAEKSRRLLEEQRLPQEERQKALRKRMEDELRQMMFDNQKRRIEMEKRQAEEIFEALGSQRLGAIRVAEANRKWLIKNNYAKEGSKLSDIVERLLWEMIKVDETAKEVSRMLETWKNWTDNGGMTRAQFEALKDSQLVFAYASCILGLIRETAGDLSGCVVSDLQECLRMWKRVRLG